MLNNGTKIIEDLERTWFTADHHFGHANIIKFTDRPFDSVAEMDEALVENWNSVIGPDDRVFHLGDFTLGNSHVAYRYLQQLQGRISFLYTPWHHDRRWLPGDTRVIDRSANHIIEWLPPLWVLEVPPMGKGGYPLAITLCHYPLAEWDRKHYGAWHLHGHSHGKHGGEGYILDVGVDAQNYHPISLGGVLDKMYGIGWD